MYYRDFKGIIKILQASLLFFYLFNAFQAKITSYVIHNSLSLSCALRSFFHSGWPWLGFKGTACDWRVGNIKESQL